MAKDRGSLVDREEFTDWLSNPMEWLQEKMTRLAARIPILTLVTGYVYWAGGEFTRHYWRALGVPLMYDNRTLPDLLENGALSIVLLFTAPFRSAVNWIAWRLGACVLIAAAWEGAWLLKRSRWMLHRNLKPRREWLSKAWRARCKAAFRFIDRFVTVVGIPHSVLTIIAFVLLATFFPLLGVAHEGTREGLVEAEQYGKLAQAMRDRLVDVTIGVFRLTRDQAEGEGVAMGCSPDRCAFMTLGGPISVPKDQVLYETTLKADLSVSCYTAEAIRRRSSVQSTDE